MPLFLELLAVTIGALGVLALLQRVGRWPWLQVPLAGIVVLAGLAAVVVAILWLPWWVWPVAVFGLAGLGWLLTWVEKKKTQSGTDT